MPETPVSAALSAPSAGPGPVAPALPRVGIVIRTKDRPLFVIRALKSVLEQTTDAWRVQLVNDGGDVAALSAAIAAAGLEAPFADGRMHALHLPASVGRSDAFNRGAEALETEFVCCLDDDDTWNPEFLAALLAFHDQTRVLTPDLGGVAAMVTAVREDIQTEDGREVLVRLGEDELPHAFRRTDFFLNPVAYATYRQDLYPVQWMLRRDFALQVGGFPSDFNVMEDRAFMTRFVQHWQVALLDRKLAFHHRRVRRRGDTAQNLQLNTLDNPSYDWRLFADLSKIAINSPPEHGEAAMRTGAMVRSVAATIVKELNDETSGLWHKINGETAALRARLEALDARIGAVKPPETIDTPADRRVWSLWEQMRDAEIGYPLGAGTVFYDRMALSMADSMPGLMLHASRAQQRFVIQIPRTENWTGVELDLTGLARRGEGLRCELIVTSPGGYLFETSLSLLNRDKLGRKTHRFEEVYVHSCPPGGAVRVVREFRPELLERGSSCKFSIGLPRQALDFRLCLNDLVVSRL